MERFRIRLVVVMVLLLGKGIADAAACPICYGGGESPAKEAMNMAIISLLGVTGGVLAGFGTLILRMRRRARTVSADGATGADLIEARDGDAASHG